MQHGGQTDDGGGLLDQPAHGGRALVHVAVDLRQRAVVADGAGQYEGNAVFDDAVHDAVVDVVVFDEAGNGAAAAHLVDHVQMVVMAVGLGFLGVDVLAQRGVEQRTLQIVGRQRVSGQQPLRVARVHQRLHRPPRVVVEGERGAHHPQHVAAVGLFIAQQIHQLVVVAGIGGLAAAALTEHELVVQRVGRLLKAVTVHIDALFALFGAAEDYPVAAAQVAVFHHRQPSVRAHDHAGVHAALLGQHPAAVDFEVFGIHGGAVVIFGRHAVLFDGGALHVRRVDELGPGKIGMMIARQFRRQGDSAPSSWCGVRFHDNAGGGFCQCQNPRRNRWHLRAGCAIMGRVLCNTTAGEDDRHEICDLQHPLRL